ncbi:hypothetical protein, partial [Flavobacterium sp.]|uniref:hypothetical protein n=1 Tax=Flavobacterium sp. TaxID=239 RepID=UPI0037BE5E49
MQTLQILSDIGCNLDIKPVNEIDDNQNTQSPAFEYLKTRESEIQKFIDTHLAVEHIQKSELVSREMATEVFTMLPPIVNIDSRLTHRPSVHNKAFVLDQIKGWDKQEEIRSFLTELRCELATVRENVSKLTDICSVFLALAEPEYTRLDAR